MIESGVHSGGGFRTICYTEAKDAGSKQSEVIARNEGFHRPVCRLPDPMAVRCLFDTWLQGDTLEQRETLEALGKGIDENRPKGHKLFS